MLGCGAVAAHEFYYLFAADRVSAKVVGVGKNSIGLRHAVYWADYEYVDSSGITHVARAEGVPAVTRNGQAIAIQYLRHSPATSRLAVSPAGALCYGSVADWPRSSLSPRS